MSLDIDWTESEGDTDDNLELENFRDSSDDEQEFQRAARGAGASARGDSSQRVRRTREEELEPEVEEAYQEARNLYTNGDYESALVLLEEAIKHESQSKLLYNLLANIHEERRDMEKALLARIAVAHLDKRDKDTWIDIAERSVQLGYLEQAAVFFQQVSRLDRDSWQLLRTRADLHAQLGQPVPALGLLQRIRTKFFPLGEEVQLTHADKTEILLNIAGCLKELGRVDEATQIYLDIFSKSLSVQQSAEFLDPDHDVENYSLFPEVMLDWQNLNVLLELLLEQRLYQQIVIMAKDGARFIRGRGAELCWQAYNLESDSEFDNRRFQLAHNMPSTQRQQIHNLNDLEGYDMPIDIRIWLLESRLKLIPSHLLLKSQSTAEIEQLPAVEDALIHLTELQTYQPVEEYSDLYHRAAVAFFDARLYAEARELYIQLTGIAHESMEKYLEMNVQVAKCEMELHNIERATQLYQFVLEKDPENQEALVAMCEIYSSANKLVEFQETLSKLEFVRSVAAHSTSTAANAAAATSGNANANMTSTNDLLQRSQQLQADSMVNSANRANAIIGASSASFADGNGFDQLDRGAGNVFMDTTAQRTRAPGARLNRAERAELERNAQSRADAAFSGLARYQSGLESNNAVAVMEWLRFADDLVEMFASHRKFFPASRQKDFFAFEGSSRTSLDQRMERLRLARDDQEIADLDNINVNGDGSSGLDGADQQPTREQLEDSYIWRGQPLSFWFLIICQCALIHAKSGDSERAQQVITTAQAANVFSLNNARRDTMDFVAISCAYLCRDYELTGQLWRHLQTRLQFNTVTYQLYIALFSSGKQALEVFASSNNQKFFLRQIKALDSLVHVHGPVVGMAKVLDPESAPKIDDPHLLMLYVYIMLQGPSYSPALTYLIRCRAQLRYHPLVLLVYGIVQMHRSTQRTSSNRHTQLLEGLSFLKDYAKYRLENSPEGSEHHWALKIETLYNLGRFFHGVGLLSIAIRYYEQALELSDKMENPDYNIAREAAYNLQLIFMESANPRLSLDIINKYLVI